MLRRMPSRIGTIACSKRAPLAASVIQSIVIPGRGAPQPGIGRYPPRRMPQYRHRQITDIAPLGWEHIGLTGVTSGSRPITTHRFGRYARLALRSRRWRLCVQF